jgi:site-specific DNA-adenine methylase
MSYPGGKEGSGTYQNLINNIPPHQAFISGFLGNCAIMRLKKPAKRNIGIEINRKIIKRWVKPKGMLDYEIRRECFVNWIDSHYGTYWSNCEDAFFFLDPPYLNTRSRIKYESKFAISAHLHLLERILKFKAMVMLVGYPSKLYERMLGNWSTFTYENWTRGHSKVTEKAWCNYGIPPSELHDYQYLGKDYRDRERIKRKRSRNVRKILSLPELERAALFEELKLNQK